MNHIIFRLPIIVTILFINSCSHFSSEVHLTEKEKDLYSSIHQSLKSFGGIEDAEETSVLIYRNWKYSGLWNDLESWKASQELFYRVCTEYWKVPVQNVKVIEHDRAGLLEYYLKNFKGKKLIIYFVSHQNSEGQIILNNGSFYSTSRFAQRLNALKSKTLLIFDTCYAEYLKRYLTNSNISVYYGSPDKEEAYDFRPQGQKRTLSESSDKARKFIKAAWGIDMKSISPFGFYMVRAISEESYEGYKMRDMFSSIISMNRKMTKITGLGRYPQVSWEDKAGWGSLVLR